MSLTFKRLNLLNGYTTRLTICAAETGRKGCRASA